jgi:hypothetical protein
MRVPDLGLKIFTAVLFIFILTTIITVGKVFRERSQEALKASQIFFSDEHRFFDLLSHEGNEVILKGFYGRNIPLDLPPNICKTPALNPLNPTIRRPSPHSKFNPLREDDFSVYGPSSSSRFCRNWKYRAHLDINYEKKKQDVSCYHFHWTGVSEEVPLKDCFDISSAFWFGMGHVKGGHWPLNGLSMNATPFVTSHDPERFNFGSIIKRYFLSSNGVAIHVPLSVPLFVSFNSTVDPKKKRGDSLLCLESRPNTQPYFTPSLPAPKFLPHLDYSICTGKNMYSLHQVVFQEWTRNLDNPRVNNGTRVVKKNEIVTTTTMSTTKQEADSLSHANESLIATIISSDITTEEPIHTTTLAPVELNIGKIPPKKKDHSLELIQNIIWTTDGSTHLPNDLDETSILSFLDSILNNGHRPAMLLIDDRWEKSVGELVADESSFPSLPSFYYYIRTKGFKSILSVSPFVGIGNPIIEDSSRDGRFLVDPKLRVPLLTKCFRGQKQDLCALIDVSNTTSRQWFWNRFKQRVFEKHHFHGLYFAGVHVSMMPRRLLPPEVEGTTNPDYLQVFYSSLSRRVSCLTGFDIAVGHQRSNSIFYRILPRDSTWEAMREIIPISLSVSLIGYNVINPGSIGGDIGLTRETYDKDLYLRWMQLAMFLPVVQLSDPPAIMSNNDSQVIRCFHRLYSTRKSLIEAAFMEALRENTVNSYPVIRGMNFLDPSVSTAYRINDQFAIGNDIVVAPVVEKGVEKRTIFLPKGKWRHGSRRRKIWEGSTWLQDFPVPLDEIAYFVRVSDDEINHDSIDEGDW